MSTIKLDHTYVSVENMDRAIAFYEDLFQTKVTHREEDQWADFRIDENCYFGLIGAKVLGPNRIVGNNSIPVFWSDDVDSVYQKIQKYGVKVFFAPKQLAHTPYHYYCFACQDTEGNSIEISNYDRKK